MIDPIRIVANQDEESNFSGAIEIVMITIYFHVLYTGSIKREFLLLKFLLFHNIEVIFFIDKDD